ncbi:MAG: glycosyltransferase [Gaiellaceae bacterium]
MRRVTIVTHELRGFLPVGGMGTATTFLALALARMGHSVEILLGVMHRPESIDPGWQSLYDSHGIRIRPVPPNQEAVAPAQFERTYGVARALQADPPDVVVVHDLAAPAYAALQLRHLTEALQDTLFVVFCHGTRRWVLEMSRRLDVADLTHVLRLGALEQMSLELADVVVSPSAYLVDWMRRQGWRLPERTLVVPYLTRSAALGESPPAPATDGARGVQRIAFFGRLEEKKGLTLFAAALNTLPPKLLAGIELEFVGRPTATWPPERVEQLLSQETRAALGGITFVGDLDQAEALARLKRGGTLAVTPSLGDNSPNTVYECIEHGVPLIASNAGGIPELVAAEDRQRVLFEPTPEGMAEALRRAMADAGPLRPPRAAFSGAASYRAWAELLELRPQRRSATAHGDAVDVVVVQRGSREALERCLAALGRQTSPDLRVHAAPTREEGLGKGDAPYVVFLDEEDVPDPQLIERLLVAQARSGADAVSCGLRIVRPGGGTTLHFFSGQPGGLGVLANEYGTVALLRRDALARKAPAWPADHDPDWQLLAGLTAAGANVVSVPEPLVTRSAAVGTLEDDPGDALLAVHEVERSLPRSLRGTARLAAGLAANAPRADGAREGDAGVARFVLRLRAAARRLSGPRR